MLQISENEADDIARDSCMGTPRLPSALKSETLSSKASALAKEWIQQLLLYHPGVGMWFCLDSQEATWSQDTLTPTGLLGMLSAQ